MIKDFTKLRDFWFFLVGQFISVIGDGAVNIALAWWILDKTGSAMTMSIVLAPMVFTRVALLPLLGPIGDRYSRKWIAIISDVARGLTFAMIAIVAYLEVFNLTLIIILFIISSIGSALFMSVSQSIIPQLVKKEELPRALRHSNAVLEFGMISGGIIGGFSVTYLGVGGAFLLNAVTFFIATIFTFLIKSNTKVERVKSNIENVALAWISEVRAGLKIIIKIPVEFWLVAIAALLNLLLSPINIALPVFVKEVENMPAWFLGTLFSSLSLGAIIGTIILGRLNKCFHSDQIIVASTVIFGLGISMISVFPNPYLPILMMFIAGVALVCINIPIFTQSALAMPDEYRSRTSSVKSSIVQIMNPLGLVIAGPLVAYVGADYTINIIGICIIIVAPFLLLIPKFSEFYRSNPEKASTFFKLNYPKAFREIESDE